MIEASVPESGREYAVAEIVPQRGRTSSPVTRSRITTTVALVTAAVALAACGSGPDRAERRSASTTAISTPPTVDHARMHHGSVPTSTSPTTRAPVPGATAAPTPGPTQPQPATAPGPDPAPTPTTAEPTTPPSPTTTVMPFDPNAPIDLSGTPGVTPAQVTAAETLLRTTLTVLPRFATTAAAYAAGYRSIGDALTGDEHWINWDYLDDGRVFDPRYPESLVYRVPRSGYPKLEAAMFMLPTGSTFVDIPPLYRSALTQFHVHRDICFAGTADPLQRVVAGFANSAGECPVGTTADGNVPMLHVWIVPHPCGPFAALEGIGAGQVSDGETHNCDTLHSGH